MDERSRKYLSAFICDLRDVADPANVSREQFDETIRGLQDLASHAVHLGDVSSHPWRDAGKTFYSPAVLEGIDTVAESLLQELEDVERHIHSAQAVLPFSPIETFADVDAVASVADTIEQSPGAPTSVLLNEVWNAPPTKVFCFGQRPAVEHRYV